MKGVIVCAFDTYFDRVRLLRDFYRSKGEEVTVITSNFSHRSKEVVDMYDADVQIPVHPYYKNLSVDRLRSHYEFAKKAKQEVANVHPDWIHCLIPANSLTKTMAQYKREHPYTKLIFDVIDLWPETMPIQKYEWLPPLQMWKNMRDRYLDEADLIFTECHLYQTVLKKEQYAKYHTLYWARKERPYPSRYTLHADDMHFCYLGSINHIIDIDVIVDFLTECQSYTGVHLHIIGKGESKEELVQRLEEQEIVVHDHGVVFDQRAKQKIFDECNYGLNVMKESVVVGLSMKSLDYMCGGLPMINTIGGDTRELCDEHDIGFNLDSSNQKAVAKLICEETTARQLVRRDEIKKVYLKYFTQDSFNDTLTYEGLL